MNTAKTPAAPVIEFTAALTRFRDITPPPLQWRTWFGDRFEPHRCGGVGGAQPDPRRRGGQRYGGRGGDQDKPRPKRWGRHVRRAPGGGFSEGRLPGRGAARTVPVPTAAPGSTSGAGRRPIGRRRRIGTRRPRPARRRAYTRARSPSCLPPTSSERRRSLQSRRSASGLSTPQILTFGT